MESELH